jgi:hypothetical protein
MKWKGSNDILKKLPYCLLVLKLKFNRRWYRTFFHIMFNVEVYHSVDAWLVYIAREIFGACQYSWMTCLSNGGFQSL